MNRLKNMEKNNMTTKPKFTSATQAKEALAKALNVNAAAESQLEELTLKQAEEENALLEHIASVMKELIAKRGIEAGQRILHRAQKLLTGDFGKPKGAKKPNRTGKRGQPGAQEALEPTAE